MKVLSNSSLKMIAVFTMLIDHTGLTLIPYIPSMVPYYSLFRDIGRMAFPIFCFLLIEGFCHTSNRKRYGISLFLFALLSEIPFDLAVNPGRSLWHYQNVLFTLLIGYLMIWGIEYCYGRLWLQILIPVLALGLAYWMKTDYSWKGVLLILLLYLFRYDKAAMTITGCLCLLWEWKAIFAFIPINLYNGKRGWMKGGVAKYAFYLFYPAHMLILSLLRYHFFTTSLPLL